MPRAQRLTRRLPVQMTDRAYRRLRDLSRETGLPEGEVLSFLFENFDSVMHKDNLPHRLDLYRQMLARRKAKGAVE